MKLRMEQKTEQITIEHNGATGIFEIRPLNVNEAAALLKKHTPLRKWIGNTMVEKDPDFIKMRIEKIQKIIISWDVEDEAGNIIECSDENKKTAFLLNPELINKVLAKADEISTGIEKAEEEEIKNL